MTERTHISRRPCSGWLNPQITPQLLKVPAQQSDARLQIVQTGSLYSGSSHIFDR